MIIKELTKLQNCVIYDFPWHQRHALKTLLDQSKPVWLALFFQPGNCLAIWHLKNLQVAFTYKLDGNVIKNCGNMISWTPNCSLEFSKPMQDFKNVILPGFHEVVGSSKLPFQQFHYRIKQTENVALHEDLSDPKIVLQIRLVNTCKFLPRWVISLRNLRARRSSESVSTKTFISSNW